MNQSLTNEKLSNLRKAQSMLEFDKVIEQLTSYTKSPISFELASNLSPKFELDQINYLQRETLEATKLVDTTIEFALIHDPRPIIRRAVKGGILSGEELIVVAEGIRYIRKAKSLGSKLSSETPLLAEIIKGISDFAQLETEIRRSVSTHGELLDQASPLLRELRVASRSAYRRAEEKLESIIESEQGLSAVQEPVITFRSDRLVLPIKSDFKGQIPGIIHGVSDSGATLFVEPFSSVEITNYWKEKFAAEQHEVKRILYDLTEKIARVGTRFLDSLQFAGRLDLAFAKARYALTYQGIGLVHSSQEIELIEARHPLLGNVAVPISIRLSDEITSLVITGPNTGGKTAALKTLGLLILMRQAGLLIPCDGNSKLPFFDGVFADIGDHQDLGQSISTFSSHLLSLKQIIECATPVSLVLLDELGSSTDPEEGSALAIACLEYLVEEIGAYTVITTHHRTVATYASEHSNMENASVDLDPTTLKPTFKLIHGLPGRSYAIETAKRVGLPIRLVRKSEKYLSPVHQEMEKLLLDVQKEQLLARRKLEEIEEQRIRVIQNEEELRQQIREARKSQDSLILETKAQILAQVREIKIKLKKASAYADWLMSSGGSFHNEEISRISDELNTSEQLIESRNWISNNYEESLDDEYVIGAHVQISPFGFVGRVIEPPDELGNCIISVGSAKLKLHTSRLNFSELPVNENPNSIKQYTRLDIDNHSVGDQIDIRGLDSSEALDRFLNFMSQAISSGLIEIRVIHGHGKGVLKRTLWENLARSEFVKEYRLAARHKGGGGVTEITLTSPNV